MSQCSHAVSLRCLPTLPCSFSARVQGAADPFYTSAVEGEVFGLQNAHFCRALPTAAATMKKGEQARLVVRPDYGFGDGGRGPEVPGGATLELYLTLLTWHRVEKVTGGWGWLGA